MLSLSNPPRKNGGKRRKQPSSNGNNPPNTFIPRRLNIEGDVVFKRMSYGGISLQTNSSGNIPVSVVSSATVQSLPATEWVSFANRYQFYRIRALRVQAVPLYPVNTTAIPHGILARGCVMNAYYPAQYENIVALESSKASGTFEHFTDVLTWDSNPNARLWNSTINAPIPANQFAWVASSNNAIAQAISTVYYILFVQWDVEFRGSQ
jgi:hypothetical protein